MYSESKVIVRYAETDQMGIAHHSNYPIWYELARTEFIKQNGMTYSDMEKKGFMTPLIELNSKYIMPAHYEDELIIKTKVGKLTPVRAIFEYEIYKRSKSTEDSAKLVTDVEHEKEGSRNKKLKLINTGSTMHVFTNSELKPVNLKKENKETYEFFERLAKEEGE